MHNDDAITASLAAPSASLALETFRRVLLPVGGPETDAALVLAAPCLSLLRLGAAPCKRLSPGMRRVRLLSARRAC